MVKKILCALFIIVSIASFAWFIGIVWGRTTIALEKIEDLEENCYDLNYYVITIDKKIDQLQEKINNAQK